MVVAWVIDLNGTVPTTFLRSTWNPPPDSVEQMPEHSHRAGWASPPAFNSAKLDQQKSNIYVKLLYIHIGRFYTADMHTIQVSKWDEGWFVAVDDQERFVSGRLVDVIRRAGRIVGNATPLGESHAATWKFTDDFMAEARAVAEARRELANEEARVARRTNDAIITLAKNGLTNGDIAAVLGLTPSRVSQIVMDTAEWLWGVGAPNAEIEHVKLLFGNGWRMGRGRGPLPPEIEFGGETYVPTGLASSVGNQPMKHTYVPKKGNQG